VNGDVRVSSARIMQITVGQIASDSIVTAVPNTTFSFATPNMANLMVTDYSGYNSATFQGMGNGSDIFQFIETNDPKNLFSPTKDNAGTINIYQEAGDLKVQNKRAVDVYLSIRIDGLTP